MPAEIYEIVALAARFWFLFLMALIVWRSYRWYAKERRQRKKRLRILPDAGFIGELVVTKGAGDLAEGAVLSVPFEGTLGFVRSNDICVPAPNVARRHLWFSYDAKAGLVLTALGHNDFSVDERTIGQDPGGLCMQHGSRLYIGEAELRLRMFAGYEVGMVMGPSGRNAPPPQDPQAAWDAFIDQLGNQQTIQPQAFMPYAPWQNYGVPPVQNPAGMYAPPAYPYAAQQPQPMWAQEAPMPQPQWQQPPAQQPQWAAPAPEAQPQFAPAPERQPEPSPQWNGETEAAVPAAPIGQPVAAKAFRVDEETLQTLYEADDDDAWFTQEEWGEDSAPQSTNAPYVPEDNEWDEPPVFHPLVEDEEDEAQQPGEPPMVQPSSIDDAQRMDGDEEQSPVNIFAAAYSANLRRAAEQKRTEKPVSSASAPAPNAALQGDAPASESIYTVSYLAEKTATPAPAKLPPQASALRPAASSLLKTAPLRVPGSRPSGKPEHLDQGGDDQ